MNQKKKPYLKNERKSNVHHELQCETRNYSVKIDGTKTKAYPHIIIYDLESMLPDFDHDRNKKT